MQTNTFIGSLACVVAAMTASFVAVRESTRCPVVPNQKNITQVSRQLPTGYCMLALLPICAYGVLELRRPVVSCNSSAMMLGLLGA